MTTARIDFADRLHVVARSGDRWIRMRCGAGAAIARVEFEASSAPTCRICLLQAETRGELPGPTVRPADRYQQGREAWAAGAPWTNAFGQEWDRGWRDAALETLRATRRREVAA